MVLADGNRTLRYQGPRSVRRYADSGYLLGLEDLRGVAAAQGGSLYQIATSVDELRNSIKRLEQTCSGLAGPTCQRPGRSLGPGSQSGCVRSRWWGRHGGRPTPPTAPPASPSAAGSRLDSADGQRRTLRHGNPARSETRKVVAAKVSTRVPSWQFGEYRAGRVAGRLLRRVTAMAPLAAPLLAAHPRLSSAGTGLPGFAAPAVAGRVVSAAASAQRPCTPTPAPPSGWVECEDD